LVLFSSPHHTHSARLPTRRSADLRSSLILVPCSGKLVERKMNSSLQRNFMNRLETFLNVKKVSSLFMKFLWSDEFIFRSTNLPRSEEHTSELQSRFDIVCCLLLDK